MEEIKILWTGGWDSTFRILQLSTKEIVIQPFYVFNEERRSRDIELRTIREITKSVQSRSSTKCIFKKLIVINVSDIKISEEISNAYHTLREDIFLGTQYLWLAAISKKIGNVEISIQKDTNYKETNPINIINKYGKLKELSTNFSGKYYKVDNKYSSDEIIQIFGNYHFPLVNFTKLDMKKEIEEMGLMDIMNKTWFCHKPIDNKPCGICSPCIYAIEEGLESRFTEMALKRYKYKATTFIWGQ